MRPKAHWIARLLSSLAFFAWMVLAMFGSLYVVMLFSRDPNSNITVACWIGIWLLVGFSPVLIWDTDRQILSLRSFRGNILDLRERGTVGVLLTVGIALIVARGIVAIVAIAVRAFVLLGIIGLLTFGIRQLFQ